MALKGGRSIVVRGVPFKWKLKSAPTRIIGDSPRTCRVVALGPVGSLKADLVSDIVTDEYTDEHGGHRASVTPKDVQWILELALTEGWNPEAHEHYTLRGPLKLTDYSVAPGGSNHTRQA